MKLLPDKDKVTFEVTKGDLGDARDTAKNIARLDEEQCRVEISAVAGETPFVLKRGTVIDNYPRLKIKSIGRTYAFIRDYVIHDDLEAPHEKQEVYLDLDSAEHFEVSIVRVFH